MSPLSVSRRTRSVLVACVLLLTPFALAPGGASAQTTKQTNAKPITGASDPGGTPKDYRSQWFLMHTDLSGAEADELLKRLEKMLALVSKYWGRPPQKIIEIYVIKDLKNWPDNALESAGRASVASGGGITLSRGYALSGSSGSQGNQPRRLRDVTSVCYAGADRGTPQHEAVHAYCSQTFGTTGPVWYSEGMAEMGQYWRDGDNKAVQIHPGVVDFLRKDTIKSLNGIVNNNESTGDSWQNYAWRWALCHLLANNPNYANQFRPLGLDILTGQNDNSFEKTYGRLANEISFEYKFFIANLCNGYRCDLAAFDWRKKFLPLQGTAGPTTTVLADRGWQPTAAMVTTDKTYEYTASGSWQLSKDGDNLGPAGRSDGKGRLVGAVMKDFELSKPFDLGAGGDLTPPTSGNLWVRCQDEWGELADNKGKVTFKIAIKK